MTRTWTLFVVLVIVAATLVTSCTFTGRDDWGDTDTTEGEEVTLEAEEATGDEIEADAEPEPEVEEALEADAESVCWGMSFLPVAGSRCQYWGEGNNAPLGDPFDVGGDIVVDRNGACSVTCDRVPTWCAGTYPIDWQESGCADMPIGTDVGCTWDRQCDRWVDNGDTDTTEGDMPEVESEVEIDLEPESEREIELEQEPDAEPLCSPANCDDGDQCTTDRCESGRCVHTVAVGADCEQTDPQYNAGACDAVGQCVGYHACTTFASCPLTDQCHRQACRDRICDPSLPSVPSGGSCDDGDAATNDDVCQADGTCRGFLPQGCPEDGAWIFLTSGEWRLGVDTIGQIPCVDCESDITIPPGAGEWRGSPFAHSVWAWRQPWGTPVPSEVRCRGRCSLADSPGYLPQVPPVSGGEIAICPKDGN